MKRLGMFYLLMALVGQVTVAPAQADNKPRTARQFFKARVKMRGTGGAGNGGGIIPNQVFVQGLIGIQYLRITSQADAQTATGESRIVFDDALVKKILAKVETVEIVPVEFNLCPSEDDGDCLEPYALKNYPEQNTILVDVRDLPGRWKQLKALDQRRLAAHEFSALEGVETNNHFFTSQIDDSRYLTTFESRQEQRTYFKLLANLLKALPGQELGSFVGQWKLRTVVRPNRTLTKFDASQGQALMYEMDVRKAEGGYLLVDSISREYKPSESKIVETKGMTVLKLLDEGLVDERAPHRGRFVKRVTKRYQDLLDLPSTIPAAVIYCKALSDDELLCRRFYWQWAYPSPIAATFWRVEYVFYNRAQ